MFFIITVPSTSVLAQEEAAYRVEVIVLRHLDAAATPAVQAEPRDFSTALDLLLRKQNHETVQASKALLFPYTNIELLPAPPLQLSAQTDGPWADVILLENRSEQMSTVWRNLRLSENFRPEAFLGWEQSAEEPFPLLRVHNEEILEVEDLYAFARSYPRGAEANGRAEPARVFHYSIQDASVTLIPIPDPITHYVVEGALKLRRTRFLHIDIDLEMRSRARAAQPGPAGPPLLPQYQGYEVHTLKQSRQVRTGRLEYFDSPVLGALVRVIELERGNMEAGQ
jgi:hypothetical protein